MLQNKKKSLFQLKIQSKIHRFFLDFFEKSDFRFKEQKFFISIIDIDISPDMKNLKIIIDIQNIPDKEKNKVITTLNIDNLYTIKHLLAKNANLKYVPDYKFILDETNEKLFKINSIIEKELKKNYNN